MFDDEELVQSAARSLYLSCPVASG